MPELATGLTNILIVISAFCCMLWLRRFENVQLWQALFIVVAFCGVMGSVTHCFVFAAKTEQTLWIILDFLLGAALCLMSLAAINQCVGHPTWQATLAATLQGIVTVFFMVKSELADGSFNYPAIIILALLSLTAVAIDCATQIKHCTNLKKFRLVIPGIAIMLAAGIPCIWCEYCVSIGDVLINQSAVLHIAIAIGLQFICIGTCSLLLDKQKV